MPGLVYILCAITSVASGALLLRAALGKSGSGLLFWSSLCFFGMALNNVLMYVDLFVIPKVYFTIWPNLAALVSIAVLCVAIIWYST